jgi:hypothetical protein
MLDIVNLGQFLSLNENHKILHPPQKCSGGRRL